MPIAKTLIIFIFLALTSLAHAGELSGKVVGISDGDTITVLTPDHRQIKVRLYGIDCPEKGQAFGQGALGFYGAHQVAAEN